MTTRRGLFGLFLGATVAPTIFARLPLITARPDYILQYRGIPIRVVDKLTLNEARVL